MKELVPNLLPFLVMSLSQSVYGGIMASLGLEALGIGSRREPTMGMTLFYVNYYSAFLLGLWWWIIEPVAVIVLTLTSLVLTSIGLDEIANPRTTEDRVNNAPPSLLEITRSANIFLCQSRHRKSC